MQKNITSVILKKIRKSDNFKMSMIKKNSKEVIIKEAFEIVKEEGIDNLNARKLAKKLKSSVQPIFYQFNSMEELKKELLNFCLNYYQDYLLKFKNNKLKYKEIGLNYINFAKENPNIFKFIFMQEYSIKIEEFSCFDKGYEEAEKILYAQNSNISMVSIKKFHLKMWMFIHGISCLLVTKTCKFTEEEMSNLLTEEFQALLGSIIKNQKES